MEGSLENACTGQLDFYKKFADFFISVLLFKQNHTILNHSRNSKIYIITSELSPVIYSVRSSLYTHVFFEETVPIYLI